MVTLRSRPSFLLIQVILWVLLTLIPLSLSIEIFGLSTGLIRVIAPMITIVLIFYANVYFVRRYLFQAQGFVVYYPFLAYSILIPITFLGLEQFFLYLNKLTNISLRFIVEASQNGVIISTNKGLHSFPRSVIALIVVSIYFISSLYGLGLEFAKRNQIDAALKATNLKNELKLLRRQINPHFLFNALNNLYALIQLQPQKAGDFVLKLSDMLRYVTYDCQQEKVSIQKEVNYIRNYIYLQQWKDARLEQLEVQIDPNLPDLEVEPMLLLPFVENAFKHSYNTQNPQERWVRLELYYHNNILVFVAENSLSPESTKEEVPDEYMGIGIENVQKRLDLLYTNRHQLQIEEHTNHFRLELTLQLANL
ncbi:MAG: sensor histidine kinase [Aureispira sp.]